MRIYLDICCYNRPFDDQSALSVRFETEAVLNIQEKIESGLLSVAWSYILDFENAANPFPERQADIMKWKSLADSFTGETPEILANMDKLIALRLKPLDALHVACAIALECQYFLTVDKGVIKKANFITNILIINPVTFIMQWEDQL
jgi:predicted nucleic acid-binding protein